MTSNGTTINLIVNVALNIENSNEVVGLLAEAGIVVRAISKKMEFSLHSLSNIEV